jgi:putative FmdB family regulatory protein
MPIYEYQCQKCGEVSEVLMITKDDDASCSHCGSKDLTKLMSAHNTTSSSASFSAPVCGGCNTAGMCASQGGGMCGAPGSCCAN